ncbi:polysaccharide deacetylase family protein [Phyllobacterium zundukense]|uniref:polysaccharide deacetylase family protein n=1 Tax=Phyllobacterium zundukense TaxID=1867719 RepID=UPI001F00FA1F|nr:polysaccharide deacetylase family protein [Phyllobacterium zundukense]
MKSVIRKLLVVPFLFTALPAAATEKTIYLTFDDGPLNGTSNILQVVDREEVPATMFMVGMHADASQDRKALVAKAKSMRLVTVGNHSNTHAYNHYRYFYSSVEGLLADLDKANEALGLKGTTDLCALAWQESPTGYVIRRHGDRETRGSSRGAGLRICGSVRLLPLWLGSRMGA